MRDQVTAPDGGWGYMCIVGVFISQCMDGLTIDSFGIFYLMILEKFETSATLAAWVGGVTVLAYGITGPFVPLLSSKIGYRYTTAVGAFLQFIGFILTGFVPHILGVYVGFGLFVGMGASITTVTSFSILEQYFHKKKAMAASISSTGIGVMMFASAPLIEYLRLEYGYKGTMLILGGLTLQELVGAALLRPLRIRNTKKHMHVFSIEESMTACKSTSIELKGIRQLKESELIWPKEADDNENTISKPLHGSNSQTNLVLQEPSITIENIANLEVKGENSKSKWIKYANLFTMMLVQFCIPVCDSCVASFVPALAIDHYIPRSQALFLISWQGISQVVHRIVCGFIFDTKIIRPNRVSLYIVLVLICSSVAALYPVCTRYVGFVIISIIFGGFIGIFFSQRFTMVSDIIGNGQASKSFGFVVLFNAGGHIIGRLLGGIIKDNTGSYDLSFYVAGTIGALSCILFSCISIISKTVKS